MSLPVLGHKSSWCDRHARARHASLQYLLARAAVGNDTTRTARAGRRRTVRRTARRKERCRHASPACDDGRLVSRLAPSTVARPNSKCTMFAAQESGRRLSGAIEEERVRVILVARQPAARPLFRREIVAPKGRHGEVPAHLVALCTRTYERRIRLDAHHGRLHLRTTPEYAHDRQNPT